MLPYILIQLRHIACGKLIQEHGIPLDRIDRTSIAVIDKYATRHTGPKRTDVLAQLESVCSTRIPEIPDISAMNVLRGSAGQYSAHHPQRQ